MPHKARLRLSQAVLIVLGAFLGLFLGWLAIRGTDWARVTQALSEFPPALLALAVALLMASSFIRALRWRLLWTTERVSALRLFLIENAALGLNNISPIRALDEALELGILALRDRLPGGAIVATMMLCRIQDLAFTMLFVAVAVATLPPLLRFTPAIGLTGLYFVAWLVILLNLGRIARRFPRLRHLPVVASFERALSAIRGERRRLAASFALTWTYWLLLTPIGWAIAEGVGISLPFHQLMFTVLGSIFFATAVPGLPGAVGTFEFAAVSLLGLFGVPREPAVTFSIILHAVLFVPPTIITVIVLPREGAGSIKALLDLVRRGGEARQG
jgi:uncharacterized protein (TIRG00374 family)